MNAQQSSSCHAGPLSPVQVLPEDRWDDDGGRAEPGVQELTEWDRVQRTGTSARSTSRASANARPSPALVRFSARRILNLVLHGWLMRRWRCYRHGHRDLSQTPSYGGVLSNGRLRALFLQRLRNLRVGRQPLDRIGASTDVAGHTNLTRLLAQRHHAGDDSEIGSSFGGDRRPNDAPDRGAQWRWLRLHRHSRGRCIFRLHGSHQPALRSVG